MTDHFDVQRYRELLANEHAKAERAYQVGGVPRELYINPHNGIAVGLFIALHALDRMLGNRDHDAGPTVAEAAANDAAHWNDKYAGDQP